MLTNSVTDATRETLMKNGLSNRESEVAALVATGMSNKEVADKLFVTEKTIKFHLTNIYKKMSIRSRAQLIVWCLPYLNFAEPSRGSAPNSQPINQAAADRQSTVQDSAYGGLPIGGGNEGQAFGA